MSADMSHDTMSAKAPCCIQVYLSLKSRGAFCIRRFLASPGFTRVLLFYRVSYTLHIGDSRILFYRDLWYNELPFDFEKRNANRREPGNG